MQRQISESKKTTLKFPVVLIIYLIYKPRVKKII